MEVGGGAKWFLAADIGRNMTYGWSWSQELSLPLSNCLVMDLGSWKLMVDLGWGRSFEQSQVALGRQHGWKLVILVAVVTGLSLIVLRYLGWTFVVGDGPGVGPFENMESG